MKKSALIILATLIGSFAYAEEAKPSGDTIVYHAAGKKSVHVKGCRRLTKDSAELAKMEKMTLAEAEKKGLRLCSKCPGSELNKQGEASTDKKESGKEKKNSGPAVQYAPDTKVYCDALWMRVHAENCPELILKDKKKTMTLEEADKAGYRIGESGQSGRENCCFPGYRRKYPKKEFTEDTPGIVQLMKSGKYKWHQGGCHRFVVSPEHLPMTLKKAKEYAESKGAGFYVCEHCIERGPSVTRVSMEELKKIPIPPAFTSPEGWAPKPFSPDELPSKEEINILIQQTLATDYGILETPFENPLASLEQFMGMRFFFPVHQWLTYYKAYRATGDTRLLEALRVSARHYHKRCVDYPDVAQLKARDPEGLAFMYSMAVSARITLQQARKYPDKVSKKQLGEAEGFLKTIVSVLKPICEGDDNLDPEMGIPKPLADDFRNRAFNRAANGIGTIAMAAKALEDLQALKNTTEYQPTIDRYRKCVREWVKNWKSVGCLYTEADGKKYFYYPYAATDKGKMVDGFKLFGSEDQGHFTHCLQGVYLMYEAMPECGTDDDFMTAVANAVYHNSQTKNGSIQCPSADKKKPMNRKPFGAPRDRFYLLQAFHDGIIDGQCSKLSKAKKEAALSEYDHRLKTLHAQYMKALRQDRSLIHLGEK